MSNTYKNTCPTCNGYGTVSVPFPDKTWKAIGETGVYEKNGSLQSIYDHCCGLQGFGQSLGDSCPACDSYYAVRQIQGRK